jgi:hypothetical protein
LLLDAIHYLLVIDADELIPEEGKDETYDEIVSEICDLEKSLEAELHKFEKTLGYVTCRRLVDMSF